ncbi:MAG: complex I NDUFA9 subunit family protein [Hyphomicrobiales bacterium]|nr:complex I NDUFA9 subunit family protein [Hyphomicrobiales bacterium]MBV9114254.1 complex I NDUFA9 subunit family protein [Hyphomicrobiales bacterium]MBV9519660.1 complex I NDUFA9 subunit family protein [Hyphomicrobiales bacterium]
MANEPIGMSSKIVAVFGASGFVGRHVVQALARRGYRVRAAMRRPDLAGFLQPLGLVGQIMPVQANVRFPWSVAKAAEGAYAVINLVGILAPKRRQTFAAVQDAGARAVAEAAASERARLVQISAIGADPQGATPYQRTKAAGEAAALAVDGAVVLRPSVVFGPEDDFFNRFAALARLLPVLPLIGDGVTKFQPVFVGDVAETVARAVDGTISGNTIYELGGPQIVSLKDVMSYVLAETGRSRPFLPMPFGAARIQAGVMEVVDKLTLGKLPRALAITREQVRLLEHDNLVSASAKAEARTLEGIGITPTAFEAIVPSYLWRFRRYGQFEKMREA